MPKFGTTNAIFWYFWAKILKKLLSHLNFEKTIVTFETIILKFIYLQNFTKKQ